MKKVYCNICSKETEEEMICDICGKHYCWDCSYTYTLHYQFQGSRCYECSEQDRLTPLDISKVRERIFKRLKI